MEKWQTDDMSAFEALFHQYEKLVYRTAYLVVGDREEAKDILQEVFVSVWKWRQTFDPQKGKFTTWLHRITINQCSKKRRKKQPVFLSLEEIEDKGFQTEASEFPEEVMITREEYERLMKVLNSLNAKHRSVLVLRYFNDLSYCEIAQVIDVPLGTVKSRLNQALKLLREQLCA